MSLAVRRTAGPWLLAGALLLSGCSEENTGPDGHESDFLISDFHSVPVSAAPGTSVMDAVTQLRFMFPQGGAGTLDIGRLAEAPARPFEGGVGYSLAFRGREPVQLLVSRETNGYVFLLGYGIPPGSRSGGRRTGWFAMPPEMILEDGLHGFRVLSAPNTPSDSLAHYWVIRFAAGSREALQFAAAVASADLMLAAFDDSLAAMFATVEGARSPAQLPPRYYPDGCYYSGFARTCESKSLCAQPMIGIGLDSPPAKVAHEVGHYLTQLLVGDVSYHESEGRMVDTPGIGTVYPDRSGLVEDGAHYLGYLLAGLIAGGGDPNDPAHFFNLDPAPPDGVDTPSLEGYGVLFLEAIARRDPLFVNIRDEAIEVPVAGLPRARLLGILARGPSDMDELRAWVADALTSAGAAECLAPLAAATGWMPHVYGRVVGRTWAPLPGSQVRAVVLAQGREYEASAHPALSSDLGWYDLPAAFPGPQILRVTTGEESFDFPLEVSWGQPTDRRVAAGDQFLWPDLTTLNTIGISISLGFNVAPGDTVTPHVWVGNCNFSCHDTLGVFEVSRFYVEQPIVFQVPPQPTWSLDTLAVSYSLATGEIEEFLLAGHQIDNGTELVLIGQPGLRANVSGNHHMQFASIKDAPAEEVTNLFNVSLASPDGHAYTNADLAPDGHLIVLKAEHT